MLIFSAFSTALTTYVTVQKIDGSEAPGLYCTIYFSEYLETCNLRFLDMRYKKKLKKHSKL